MPTKRGFQHEVETPNIQGTVYFDRFTRTEGGWVYGDYVLTNVAEGRSGAYKAEFNYDGETVGTNLLINAHDYNPTYTGTAMQPKALSVLPCIRY